MDELLRTHFGEVDWPPEADAMYDRVEVLGRGSYGVVWMARRIVPPVDEFDDEYAAIKNIEIKEDKSRIYAQREISILSELRHPNVIRLIRAFPIHDNRCQLVAMQMARGPNLQYLMSKRGALGLPISRLIARHLVAAVSYLHGRAVIHRDIKPTNCILENTRVSTQELYDWIADDVVWSDSDAAASIVDSGKYKLMIVDFGFARALDHDVVVHAPKRMRNSIVNEGIRLSGNNVAQLNKDEEKPEEVAQRFRRVSVVQQFLPKDAEDVPLTEEEEAAIRAAGEVAAPTAGGEHRRQSYLSKPVVAEGRNRQDGNANAQYPRKHGRRHRQSTTRTKVRSMSALGTKAYAAPEIKHQLRNKNADDIERSLEALTDCVADYGMIVDAYSVGWTLRVIMTGIPPHITISQHMKKLKATEQQVVDTSCFCFKKKAPAPPEMKFRDTSDIPKDATMLIVMLTKTNPEERMTVREAQMHPYIRGHNDEEPYTLPKGDVPSNCGDPIVPLKCASDLALIQKNFR